VPSVLVAAPDNASTEHITEGVNGFIAPDLSPQALADALVVAYERRAALRETTADWFAANAQELSVGASLHRVLEAYRTA
jgi:glycosyltransferase involved in cell wall biosynthesis